MLRSPHLRAALLVALAALAWAGSQRLAGAANRERATWPKTEEYVVLPPPGTARLLALGYDELAADVSWARALVYYGSSLTGETDLRYLERFIDTVIELDPKFQRVYRWAAYAVTYKEAGAKMRTDQATQAEYLTSVKYLERAMQEFPDGYEPFWMAGLRYWLDLKSDDPAEQQRFKERGAELIEEAMRKPDAPRDLAGLAANLRTKLGQQERALRDLKEMILTTDDEAARKKLLDRLGGLGDVDIMSEVEAARDAFDAARLDHGRALPPDVFVLIGPPPPRKIDWRELATDRDLFGADDDPTKLWDR